LISVVGFWVGGVLGFVTKQGGGETPRDKKKKKTTHPTKNPKDQRLGWKKKENKTLCTKVNGERTKKKEKKKHWVAGLIGLGEKKNKNKK